MPYSRPRFKSLRTSLKDNNGVPTAGSKAELFLNALIGKTKLTVPRHLPTAYLKKGVANIEPFTQITAAEEAAAVLVPVPFTVQAKNILLDTANLGTQAALYGHTSSGNVIPSPAGFYGARVTIRTCLTANATGATTPIISQWTGKVYGSRKPRSGSVPYGKTSSSDTEYDRREAIAGALLGKAGSTLTILGVSFRPESVKLRAANVPTFPTTTASGVAPN